MSWNYRIVRTVHQVGDEEHEWYTIREVYYDAEGNITSWTKDPCYPAGDTWQECYDDLAIMGRVVNFPIVDVSSGKPVEVPLLRRRRR